MPVDAGKNIQIDLKGKSTNPPKGDFWLFRSNCSLTKQTCGRWRLFFFGGAPSKKRKPTAHVPQKKKAFNQGEKSKSKHIMTQSEEIMCRIYPHPKETCGGSWWNTSETVASLKKLSFQSVHQLDTSCKPIREATVSFHQVKTKSFGIRGKKASFSLHKPVQDGWLGDGLPWDFLRFQELKSLFGSILNGCINFWGRFYWKTWWTWESFQRSEKTSRLAMNHGNITIVPTQIPWNRGEFSPPKAAILLDIKAHIGQAARNWFLAGRFCVLDHLAAACGTKQCWRVKQ